ncbi:hypothetical protein C6N75_05035 [Streptomyces solincola]|uniref:Uncharacterized protein n=1 Tax=Streptomyces solincola TaxID=2100817 RepID=A0A2S9Q0N3_9ACTN|nr:hypothetical protein [Streptomyces solincola]PRH80245.1 hypothetical protein C6N75_05035 [Streptomyces solincola]
MRTARLLNNSVVGMLPWMVFSLVSGPGRYGYGVIAALAAALALLALRHATGQDAAMGVTEPTAVAVFAALGVLGLTAPENIVRWLESYAGEVTNLTVVLLCLVSLAVRAPLTLPYARQKCDRDLWREPDFLRTNRVITAAWALAFLSATVADACGDLILHNPDNLWTGWLVQAAAFVTAARFTEWYPAVVRSRMGTGEHEPPVRDLLLPFVGLLIPAGILSLVFDGGPRYFSVGLIVVGVVLARALRKDAGLREPAARRQLK